MIRINRGGPSPRRGMKSITRTLPSAVSKSGLEHKRPRAVGGDGAHRPPAPSQRPCRSSPSSAAKHEAEPARKAQPVHRSVTTDEGAGVQITDEAVVLDPQQSSLPSADWPRAA